MTHVWVYTVCTALQSCFLTRPTTPLDHQGGLWCEHLCPLISRVLTWSLIQLLILGAPYPLRILGGPPAERKAAVPALSAPDGNRQCSGAAIFLLWAWMSLLMRPFTGFVSSKEWQLCMSWWWLQLWTLSNSISTSLTKHPLFQGLPFGHLRCYLG